MVMGAQAGLNMDLASLELPLPQRAVSISFCPDAMSSVTCGQVSCIKLKYTTALKPISPLHSMRMHKHLGIEGVFNGLQKQF